MRNYEEEIKGLMQKVAELELKLWQAKGALGYAVPGNIPESNEFKCGMCDAKNKRIFERDVEYNLIMKLFRLTIESMSAR